MAESNSKELEELRKKQAKIAAEPGNSVTERTTPISKSVPPLSAALATPEIPSSCGSMLLKA